ncbi:hypothetical protein J2Z60_001286 [Lactobacillus colini]|uniref:DUF4422 domain-containing protein n=1 Tax=Lactobacillus colini TaxID=1819254 RepID=A0ABS4MEN8_9LACO|nr:DUF4422 domain-containing protein [Lactobacillus colini]MBP2058109.1 hypothetical protein [Lactobacillus colini]
MKTIILVAAHKKFPMPNQEGYLPILVGADKNYREGIDYQLDNKGENISSKNPYYNELTAVYWAWKNLRDVDAIGLVHYRRYLYGSKPYNLDNVLDINKINRLLQSNDVILPKQRNYYIESNYSHYIHAHHREPLDKTRKIIKEFYPAYLSAFDVVMNKRKAHMFNMFVMKKAAFDSYCTFMFGVLNRLEKEIDISNYSVQEQRVYGYVSELLMDVWLYTTKQSFTELAWGQIGGRNTLQKGFNLIKRKLGIGKRKTHF